MGKIKPVAAVSTVGFAVHKQHAGRAWTEPAGGKTVLMLDPDLPVGTFLYTEEAIALARKEGMLKAAEICDEQAREPECHERAEYCAEAIRQAAERSE